MPNRKWGYVPDEWHVAPKKGNFYLSFCLFSKTCAKHYPNHPDYSFQGIGNDVWLGYHAIIMLGIHIGDGAIIGANSLVTKDVEPYTIVAGTPAKTIRKRFSTRLLF